MTGDPTDKRRNQGRGSMIGFRIAIGAGAGVALGLVFDNLALGIAIGAALAQAAR